MSDSMFQRLGNGQTQQQQNPREAVMNRMKEMGIQIPKGMEDDPNALLQHVLNNRIVPQNRLPMAQQMMQRMFRR